MGAWVNKMAAVVWRSLLLLFACVSAGHCLYEDEIGRTDWKQSYVGGAVQAEYDESSHNNRRFVMTTTAGVLASINTRTGKSEWSHAFSEGVDFLMHHSAVLLTYHHKQALLRSWDTDTGHLEWEIVLERTSRGGSCSSGGLSLSRYCSHGVLFAVTVNRVLVTDGVTLQAVSLTDGKVSWKQTLPDGVSGTCCGMVAADSKVYIIGTSDNALTVQEVALGNGTMATMRSIPVLWSAATSQCVVAGSSVVCVDVAKSAVFSVSVLNENKARETSFQALSVSGDFTASQLTLSTPAPPNKMEAVVVMTTKTTPSRSWVLTFKGSTPTKAIPFDAHLVLSADNCLVALMKDGEVLKMEVFSMERRERVKELATDIALPESAGWPVKGLAHVYSRNNGSYGYRLVLFMEDDVICQVKHPGELGWVREEAPAQITSHLVWDLLQLDVPPQSADQISGPARFLQRLHYQAQRVQEFFSSLTYDGLMKIFTSTTAKVYSREEFNTRKLLLVATRSGKLFGIGTEDGAFHWSRWFPDLGVYNDGSHLLFQLRDLTHPPEPPIAVLIGPGRGACEGTLILQFNPLSGEDIEQPICEPFSLRQAMLLPFVDSQHRKVLLLVTVDGRFLTYPRTEETLGLVSSSAEAVFLYFVSMEKGTIEGLQLKRPGGKRAELGAERVWMINFTAASQKIVTVVSRSADETVNAQAKVSGDHTVLFKYLNPHLIAVATESEIVGKGGVDVYVIDTVSGSIIHHTQHKLFRSPVHMVLSENWLLYYLYNSRSSRNELVVMEMYDSTYENPTEAWSSLVTHPPPVVLKQSYIFPTSVAAMTTTQTLRGISERNIIFGLQSGHLYSFPKLLLDPRRQLDPLPDEMLPPYFPEIYVNSSDFLNYNQTVTLLQSVTTHPTGLESTSIIIAYGLDLFVTVVAPSKRFDQLADDFDHQLVAAVLGALVVGALLLSRMAHTKRIKTLWK